MFSKNPAGVLSVTISKCLYNKPLLLFTFILTRLRFLVEARKLHGEDFMGKNDPYV